MVEELLSSVESALQYHIMLCCSATNLGLADTVVDGEIFVFEAVLVRKGMKKLGLELDVVADRQVIPIHKVGPGCAEDWNKKQQDKLLTIKPGDMIVAVNNTMAKAETLMDHIKDPSSEVLRLKIARPTEDQIVDDGVYAQCAHEAKVRNASIDVMSRVASAGVQMEDDNDDMNLFTDDAEEYNDQYSKALKLDYALRELPEPWTAVFSTSQNKYYYFNPDTEETTWRKPFGVHGAMRQGIGSIIGTWSYESGNFTVDRVRDVLVYFEEAHGVYGLIEERKNELIVEMLAHASDLERLPKQIEVCNCRGFIAGKPMGQLRFQRKGECLVTHYRKETSAPWGEEHSSHHITRASAKEDTNSAVGTWTYPQGTYSVARRKQDGMYLYEETCYRIYGLFADEDGWVVGKIYTLRTTDDGKLTYELVGHMRLQRRGRKVASQFRVKEEDTWENESFAVREARSIAGEWKSASGSFKITVSNGFWSYEEANNDLFGVLVADSSGWFEADLFYRNDDPNASIDDLRAGKMRVQRRGEYLVTNHRRKAADPWEADVLAYG